MANRTDGSTPFDALASCRASAGKPRRLAEFNDICASVCALAAATFDRPMSFLSLREGESLTPVATFGIVDIDVLDTLAFTQRTLVAGEGLCIGDATRDARYFLESAVLRAPHICFYADMPLVHDGEVLGVIAIADSAACADFSASKQAVLAKLADQVAILLALAQGREDRGHVPQKRLDAAAELAELGYWTIDLVSRDVVWSKGVYALLGLSETLYRPQMATQLDIYQADDRPVVIEHFQRALNNGEDFDFKLRMIRKRDKTPRLIRTKGGVEYGSDGAPARLCAVMRDVTETTPEAGAGDDLLGHVADELRDPLNAIVSYARLIETQPVSGAHIAEYARHLQASAAALKAVIGDRLAQAPATSNENEEVVDVSDMIRETADAFRLQAEAAHTRLSTRFVDFTRNNARLDVMRVRQVLQNLLSNACKFTRGGVISVTASQVMAENPRSLKPEIHLHVSVRDTGIGMEEAQAHSLFSDKTGQTRGLGLSIAQTIVERLDGHIGAVSRPGEGANVWFEIPVDWVEAPAELARPDPKAVPVPRTLTRQTFDMPQSRPAYAPPRPRIVAPTEPPPPPRHPPVDDDRINREYLRALLQDMKLDL